ncbi:MAG: sugar phosphate isomerase/epimerase [Kiritimatiellae bacterium]|nr:sugar phosphate isomerase/epimerase [Kiritimatiellia bacterium]
MKPSICTSFDYKIPFAQCITMIRQAGFEAISLGARPKHSGFDTAQGRIAIRKLVEQNGLTIDSMHAPFPEGDQLFSLDAAARLESIRQCKIAIDTARDILDINGRIVALHLIPYGIPQGDVRNRMIAQGMESLKTLEAYAAGKEVKLALENGQKLDYDQVLESCLSAFCGSTIGFCYDSGHENVQGTCYRILEKLGRRLVAVHIHDNGGSDSHMLPYEGNMDWDKFRKIFHGLAYSGNLVLEVGIAHSQFKDPTLFLSEARRRAEKLLQRPTGLGSTLDN